MGFKCGIVGLPNVGKSSLFNALTESSNAEAANYPFATIEPNIGRVPVSDERLEKLSNIAKSKKTIPAYLDVIDIAGLVKGASVGEGLGNKFLAHIREMDAIIHVVRCFENSDIAHTSPSIDPIKDIEIIETELKLADIETLQNIENNLNKKSKSGDKEIIRQLNIVNALMEKFNDYHPLNFKDWSASEMQIISDLNLITHKPMLYVCNVDERSIVTGNKLSDLVQEKNINEKKHSVLVSAAIESQIIQFDNEKDKLELLKELQLKQTTLKKVVNIGYNILNLITFFSSTLKETRAWTIKKNTKAHKAAGKIHSDFERGFIKAEIMSYNDFMLFKGEAGCREGGRLRKEGKDYNVQDGDIINFLFNV